jgi:hypothetical protein
MQQLLHDLSIMNPLLENAKDRQIPQSGSLGSPREPLLPSHSSGSSSSITSLLFPHAAARSLAAIIKHHTQSLPMIFLYRGRLSSYLSFQIFAHRKRRSLKSIKAMLTVVAMLHMIDDRTGSRRHHMPETREPMSSPLPHAPLGKWGVFRGNTNHELVDLRQYHQQHVESEGRCWWEGERSVEIKVS